MLSNGAEFSRRRRRLNLTYPERRRTMMWIREATFHVGNRHRSTGFKTSTQAISVVMRALTPSKTAVVNVLSRTRFVSAVINCSDLRNLRAAPKCDNASERGSITASRQALGYRSNQIHTSRSTICSAAAQHEMVHLLLLLPLYCLQRHLHACHCVPMPCPWQLSMFSSVHSLDPLDALAMAEPVLGAAFHDSEP